LHIKAFFYRLFSFGVRFSDIFAQRLSGMQAASDHEKDRCPPPGFLPTQSEVHGSGLLMPHSF
jgi:hypothetical protein